MDKIQEQVIELKKIDRHRKLWLFLSSLVIAVVLFIFVKWDDYENQKTIWVISTFGLLVSVIWWYWTMRMVRVLITHRLSEIQILGDLYKDIKDLRRDIKNNFDNDLTK